MNVLTQPLLNICKYCSFKKELLAYDTNEDDKLERPFKQQCTFYNFDMAENVVDNPQSDTGQSIDSNLQFTSCGAYAPQVWLDITGVDYDSGTNDLTITYDAKLSDDSTTSAGIYFVGQLLAIDSITPVMNGDANTKVTNIALADGYYTLYMKSGAFISKMVYIKIGSPPMP